jgi:hypothetical protein
MLIRGIVDKQNFVDGFKFSCGVRNIATSIGENSDIDIRIRNLSRTRDTLRGAGIQQGAVVFGDYEYF